MTTVKPASQLTLRDRLSRLTFEEASQVLGARGKKLIYKGGGREIELADNLYFDDDVIRLTFPPINGHPEAVASLALGDDRRRRLAWSCDQCTEPCEHVGTLFSTILERKVELGLAEAPPEIVAAELSDEEIAARAVQERRDRAKQERMRIVSSDASAPWTDYAVTSKLSGKTYRVALRGLGAGEVYCSCPDFRTNTLGACKHTIKVVAAVKKRFTAAQLQKPYRRKQFAVHLRYDGDVSLRLAAPYKMPEAAAEATAALVGRPIESVPQLLATLRKLDELEQPYVIYPDAEEYIQQRLYADRIKEKVAAIRRDPANHPLRTTLLKTPLLPYQLDGVAFAAGAGRAVLADDMGLGKTIQGVGVSEFLAREADIKKVLVVCPASLKSQWRNEIERFCDRDVQLIAGPSAQRTAQYDNDCFFTICNYEQVLRDLMSIEQTPWDLIILDEGQRIKNWESKTSRVIKALKSRFALCLTGTPLENRLDDLYSVVQFVDDRRLGPGFRFFHQHRLLNEDGKLLGYRRLDDLRKRLAPILLRRTRESVRLELPERSTEIVRVAPTEEQKALHDSHLQVVAQIVAKKFITEMDLLRLRCALLMCRMAANGTFLCTKEEPNYSTKLERLGELFDDMADEADRKVVLFSEWTTMLDLVEPMLHGRNVEHVRLDGQVPQKKRQELVHRFQNDPACRAFITTNAGSTGLNLQAANTVINVDLPWNPAVLEQRIARAHRMGQKRPVQVYVLVTEETLEDRLLHTLANKKELALAALDSNSEVDVVELVNNTDDLKAKLEILLGAKPEAPLDGSLARETQTDIQQTRHRERVAAAGGELLGAVFNFLGELASSGEPSAAPPAEEVVAGLKSQLSKCVQEDAAGRPQLMLTLPSRDAIDGLAQTLAKLLAAGKTN